MALPLVALLFQEVEYDRSSKNPFYFLRKLFNFLVCELFEHIVGKGRLCPCW